MFSADTLIEEVIAARPDAASVFEKHGLGCASCLAAGMESISSAAQVHDISVGTLLTELNALDIDDDPGGGPLDGR